jgi:ABC-type polysaccharide/polyol phosphate export permease
VTPILWSFTTPTVASQLQGHEKLTDLLRWGNFVTPPIIAVRDTLWLGKVPRPADLIYLAVAAVVALSLGAFVFTRVNDQIAVEL